MMQGLGPLDPTAGLLLGGGVPHIDSTSDIWTFTTTHASLVVVIRAACVDSIDGY